jgi:hypothetical protein
MLDDVRRQCQHDITGSNFASAYLERHPNRHDVGLKDGRW